MAEIKKVGRNIWLVDGKVIGSCFDGTFDDSTPEGRGVLIRTSELVRTSQAFPFGPDALYTAFFKNCSDGHGQFLADCVHLRTLPDDVKDRLRREMPEQASGF